MLDALAGSPATARDRCSRGDRAPRRARPRKSWSTIREYQHLIVNDDLERAYALLRAMYLTRRYGIGIALTFPTRWRDLARLVASNDVALAHAKKLVGIGS